MGVAKRFGRLITGGDGDRSSSVTKVLLFEKPGAPPDRAHGDGVRLPRVKDRGSVQTGAGRYKRVPSHTTSQLEEVSTLRLCLRFLAA